MTKQEIDYQREVLNKGIKMLDNTILKYTKKGKRWAILKRGELVKNGFKNMEEVAEFLESTPGIVRNTRFGVNTKLARQGYSFEKMNDDGTYC